MIKLSEKHRQALLHGLVRGFAGAGWIAGATEKKHGIKWRWYRDGSDCCVISGVILSEDRADLVDLANPDIMERFSPGDLQRICATPHC